MGQPTSVNFSYDELELLEAHAALHQQRTGVQLSRTGVLRMLLRRAKPPDGVGPAESRLRQAYRDCFGDPE